MLFLVKSESKGAYPLPPEEFLPLVAKHLEAVTEQEKQDKILAQGALAGAKGSYHIYDVESSEELHTLICELPLFPFGDWEIVPLISNEKAMESVKQSLASVRGQKK